MYQGKPPPEAKYMFFAAWKVPSPLPSSSQAVQSPKLTTARSGFPSPLKSATAMPEGPFLAPATYSVWGLNNGVCANVRFGNANRRDEVAATSNDNLFNFLFMEHRANEFQRHACTATKSTKELITPSALCGKPAGRPPQNLAFAFETFSAPTLRRAWVRINRWVT